MSCSHSLLFGFLRPKCVCLMSVCYVLLLIVIIIATSVGGVAEDDDDVQSDKATPYENNEDGNKGKPETLVPPISPDSGPPLLLHERDVIRLLDYRQNFLLIGDGTHANISLAQMRGSPSNEYVVVKTFKDSSFSHIMLEARIHQYVDDLHVTPRLIGLLPTGSRSSNLSLVFEYIPYSKSLYDFMKWDPSKSANDWLNLCTQMIRIFRLVHSHDVIFNDLHRSNIVVQKNGRDLRAFLIDFGFATYKRGKRYSNSYGSLYGYDFISPEARNGGITIKASDVYSIGHILNKFAQVLSVSKLQRLSEWCMALHPEDRPTPEVIEHELEDIRLEQWLVSVSETWPTSPNISLGSIISGLDIFSSDRKMCHLKQSTQDYQKPRGAEDNTKIPEETPVLKWLMDDEFELYSKCPVSLFVLDSFEVMFKENRLLLRTSSSNSIYLTKLKSKNETVIVKRFDDVNFGKIRYEACVTTYLGTLGIAPQIFGILPGPGETQLSNAAFVQEFYGIGLTLDEFRIRVEPIHWGYDEFKRAASDGYFSALGNNPCQECCQQPFAADLFREALRFGSNSCEGKTHKQKVFERAALRLAQTLKRVHDVGLLVNNLNEHNVLVAWNDTLRGLDVRIIDLNTMSTLDGQLTVGSPRYLTLFPYLAPEVVMGAISSRASDIYSLCSVVHRLLSDFISMNSWKIQNLKMRSTNDRSECNSTKGHRLKAEYNMESKTTQSHCIADRRKGADKSLDLSSFRLHKLKVLLSKCLGSSFDSRPSLEEIVSALQGL